MIEQILSSHLTRSLGWTIVHTLWQGAVVALLLALVLVLGRKLAPQVKYMAGVIALLVLVLAAGITFVGVFNAQGNAYQLTMATSSLDLHQPMDSKSPASLMVEKNQLRGIPYLLNLVERQLNRHLPLIVTVWLLGFLVQMLRFAGGFAWNMRLKVKGLKAMPEPWLKRFQEMKKQIGLRVPVRLIQSTLAKSPMVIGFLKPMILLPVGLIGDMPAHQVEALLFHELAHVLRKDYVVNLLQLLVEVIFFYHPAVWWISSVIRQEREKCCDDIALHAEAGSMDLAKALARLQQNQGKNREKHPLLTLSAVRNQALKRIKRLFHPAPDSRSYSVGSIAVIVFGFCLALFLSLSAANVRQEKSAKEKMSVRELITNFNQRKFSGVRVNFNVRDKDLQEFIRDMAKRRGIKLRMNDAFKGKVTFTFNKAPWDQVLDYVLDVNGLEVYENDGDLVIQRMPRDKQDKIIVERMQKKAVYRGNKGTFQYKNEPLGNILLNLAKTYKLNVVVDPGVKFGAVTLNMVNVPWDQALATMLKLKGLGMTLEGNFLRIYQKRSIPILTGEQIIKNLNSRQFSGAPITFKFYNMNLKNVIETFSKISGNKITMAPDMKARITVEAKDVPWDQFLAYALDVNKLALVRVGDVLEIRKRKSVSGNGSEEANLYRGKLVDMDFKDLPLKQVLLALTKMNNASIVLDPGCPGDAKITYTCRQIPWDQALGEILAELNLEAELGPRIIRVKKKK